MCKKWIKSTCNIKMVLFGIMSLHFAVPMFAGPINNDTAFTVAKGEYIFREQIRLTRKSGDPSPSKRRVTILQLPTVLLYGLTPKILLIGKYPLFYKKLTTGGVSGVKGRRTRNNFGFGDLIIRGKYRFFTRDKPGKTSRASLFAGLKLPTGSSQKKDSFGLIPPPLQLGTGSWDVPFGLVYTNVTLQRQIDVVAQYKVNGTNSSGFRFGDTFRHDLSYQYRILPRKLPKTGVPAFVYAVIELNGIVAQKNKNCGIPDKNSGGYTLFVSPGIQYVNTRFVAEAAIQIPTIQDLNGKQPKTRFSAVAGIRLLF